MIGTNEPGWTAHDSQSGAPIRDANFYALPFASQMIVWAMRKRIDALSRDEPGDDDVLHVFHMADLTRLYASLLTVVQILSNAGVHERSPVHAVSCPCLAYHEAYLLNALAHLQSGAREEAVLALCEIAAPTVVRLAMPHAISIAEEMTARRLRFVYVDLSMFASRRVAGQTAAGAPGHVH